jgi:hypothetical protein
MLFPRKTDTIFQSFQYLSFFLYNRVRALHPWNITGQEGSIDGYEIFHGVNLIQQVFLL